MTTTPSPEPRPDSLNQPYGGMAPVLPDGTQAEALPSDAPLTPEEIEDEAIRGDFMIRWAVVLIGLLLGCTLIHDSSALVRIRTGEFMQSHGFLPPRTDPFSIVSEGKPWYHLSWLLDHLLAILHRLGGPAALTLATSATVGLLFWMLSRITVPKISTWWGSVCAAAALVACFNTYFPGPVLVTLFGVAATALVLHRWSESVGDRPPWLLVPVIWLWAQCDPNAFIGMIVALMFALGETFIQEERPGRSLRGLWIGVGVAVAIGIVHPFHWRVFESPVHFLRVEQPEIRRYFTGPGLTVLLADYSSIASREFRDGATLFDWFGIGLIGAALLAQLVNWKHLHWGWLLPFVGVNALACASARFLPAASLVNVVVATLNGQIWYQNNCRQTYSTHPAEVFLSRAGRAVTVLGLFLLAYLSVNGWLAGPSGRRVGIGFHPELMLSAKSTADLAENQFDDRPFHVHLSQGDYLIWGGRKSFIDSRMSLHSDGGSAAHLEVRQSLLEGSPSPDAWKKVLDRFQVTYALVRNTTERDTRTILRKYLQGGWQATRVSASGMAMYRPDLQSPEIVAFRQKEPLWKIERVVFRDAPPETRSLTGSRAWPRPKGAYDRWLIQPLEYQTEGALLANQYGTLLDTLSRPAISLRTSLAIQTIREARAGLLASPQDPVAYRRLAGAALMLHAIDSQWLQPYSPGAKDEFWLREALAAYMSAEIIDPGHPRDNQVLFDLCLDAGARDWALEHLNGLLEAIGNSPENAKERQQLEAIAKQLGDEIGQVEKVLTQQIGIGSPRPKLLQTALQGGCWKRALQIYEEDITAFGNDGQAQRLYAALLLYAGRLEESWQTVEGMQSQLPPPGVPGGEVIASEWRNESALANLLNGNEDQSIQLWDEDQQGLQRAAAESSLDLAPVVIGPPLKQDLRPLLEMTQSFNQLQQLERETQDAVHAALAELVCWRNRAATRHLEEALERNPETAQRVRIVHYLSLLTDKKLDPELPSQKIPVWGEMFAEGGPGDM